jgi:hypothetical protein
VGDAAVHVVILGFDDGSEVEAVLEKAFEIRVRGAMTPEELEDFEQLSAVAVPAHTILTGPLPDQSALYGLINRLQALGLELMAVRRLEEDAPSR